MKRVLIIMIILFSGFSNGYSCSCGFMSLKSEIDSADLIFQGVPVYMQQIDSKIIYKFHVNKLWKGDYKDTIEIVTNSQKTMCGMVFEINQTYIVYSKDNQTTFCERNSLIDKTFDDLKLDYKFLPGYALTSFTEIDKQLNDNESKYLNQLFENQTKNYDFQGKLILFTSNQAVINKREWYQTFWSYDYPVIQLIKLTEQEKNDTGYDAIVVTYNKRTVTERIKQKILRQIQK